MRILFLFVFHLSLESVEQFGDEIELRRIHDAFHERHDLTSIRHKHLFRSAWGMRRTVVAMVVVVVVRVRVVAVGVRIDVVLAVLLSRRRVRRQRRVRGRRRAGTAIRPFAAACRVRLAGGIARLQVPILHPLALRALRRQLLQILHLHSQTTTSTSIHRSACANEADWSAAYHLHRHAASDLVAIVVVVAVAVIVRTAIHVLAGHHRCSTCVLRRNGIPRCGVCIRRGVGCTLEMFAVAVLSGVSGEKDAKSVGHALLAAQILLWAGYRTQNHNTNTNKKEKRKKAPRMFQDAKCRAGKLMRTSKLPSRNGKQMNRSSIFFFSCRTVKYGIKTWRHFLDRQS